MQKAERPERKAFLDNYRAAIAALALLLCSFIGQAQVFQKNTQYGVGYTRLDGGDSVFYFPTGCGVPSGIASLRSYGFGNGEKKKKAALFADTCGHHVYWFNPNDSSWKRLDTGSSSGGGTGSGFSIRSITSSNFSTGTNCPLPSLNGDTLSIFWNDLNRYLVGGVEWTYLSGGGFTINVPGFNASTNSYNLTVTANSGSISPGPLAKTSADFTTATNCPIPALNGMALKIFWNDANRYLLSSEFSALAGGGFAISISGFDATTHNYTFYIFNQ